MSGAMLWSSCGKDDDEVRPDNPDNPGTEQKEPEKQDPDKQDPNNQNPENPTQPEKKKVVHWDKPICTINEKGDTLYKTEYNGNSHISYLYENGKSNGESIIREYDSKGREIKEINVNKDGSQELERSVEYNDKDQLVRLMRRGVDFKIDIQGNTATYINGPADGPSNDNTISWGEFLNTLSHQFWTMPQHYLGYKIVDELYDGYLPIEMLENGGKSLELINLLHLNSSTAYLKDGSFFSKWVCERDANGKLLVAKKYIFDIEAPIEIVEYEYDGLTVSFKTKTLTRNRYSDGDWAIEHEEMDPDYYKVVEYSENVKSGSLTFTDNTYTTVDYGYEYDELGRIIKGMNNTYTYFENYAVNVFQFEDYKETSTIYYLETEE